MPRRRVVLFAVVFAAACGGEPPRLARTEGVAATALAPAPERWCDAFFPAAETPRLMLPRVVAARTGGVIPTVPTDRSVWINLWATWCEPCKREMPMLERWHAQLVKEGVPLDLWFVSVDEQAQDLTAFLAQHSTFAPDPSLRLATLSDLAPWLASLRAPSDGSIPVHLIAAPGGKLRCARAGALRDGDYPIVKAILTK
ncbi:MAG: TlpA family protein disulfide reductase [Thermoanaerobaculales bacterium]